MCPLFRSPGIPKPRGFTRDPRVRRRELHGLVEGRDRTKSMEGGCCNVMKRFQDVLLTLLIVGIAVQTWTAIGRTPGGDARSGLIEPLAVGDTVPLVTGYSELGVPVKVFLNDEEERVTVLYSFHPDCPHSRTWGPEWAKHLDQVRAIDTGVRRIALTLDGPSSGQDFSEHFGWDAELLSVSGLSPRQRLYSLVSRTPWVFVFDAHGVLRFDGHGGQLEQVQAAPAARRPRTPTVAGIAVRTAASSGGIAWPTRTVRPDAKARSASGKDDAK